MMDLAALRRLVERHFRVYEARDQSVRGRLVARMFYIMFPPGEFDKRYDALRADVEKEAPGHLLFLRRENGEDVLLFAERPAAAPVRWGLHIGLFLATLATTVVSGAVAWQSYWHPGEDWDWSALWDPHNLWWGFVAFALPLLAILGIHEMAHYFTARKYGLRATPPLFIPAPPILMPIGTFGAFIQMRDPLPDRKSLFDVGASGPIAGFLVALPIAILGAFLTVAVAQAVPDLDRPFVDADRPFTMTQEPGEWVLTFTDLTPGTLSFNVTAPEVDADWDYQATADIGTEGGPRLDQVSATLQSGQQERRTLEIPANATSATLRIAWDDHLVSFGDSLLVMGINLMFPGGSYLTHPTFLAGWAGLLLAGINLLPIKPLDGGHVARAALGEASHWVSRGAAALLFLLALSNSSWILFALFVLLSGAHHEAPLNDRTMLDAKRRVLSYAVLAIFLLTFVPIPIVP
ncbi:MAG: hypothetical protein QOD77_2035 [Thermoplasmata archaeon]|jgi:membrane-associated protease RseP (regulator of RpoE activity)|nr:hypothetical protein [Thermoplasmata archaeon]